jgi:hypothetical protein
LLSKQNSGRDRRPEFFCALARGIAYGLFGMPGTMAGYLIAGTGAVAILTGFFGFCPMCAMVGRKLPSS